VVNEQRLSARKILKAKAMLAMDGAGPVTGRTVDIGANGVCISVANPLQPGQAGQISFDLFYDGTPTPIHARAKVSHCIFSNGEFRVGFQFLNLNLSAMTVLAKFLR
jgi:hypothetical protein